MTIDYYLRVEPLNKMGGFLIAVNKIFLFNELISVNLFFKVWKIQTDTATSPIRRLINAGFYSLMFCF